MPLLVLAGVVVACGGGPQVQSRPAPRPSPQEITSTVLLIGDAGEPAQDSEPVLQAAAREIAEAGERATVVFLGDNIYPGGMPDSTAGDLAEAERRINAQIDLVRWSGAHGIFVPGNHDWDNGGQEGWERIRREARYVRPRGNDRIVFVPDDGCPGPSVLDAGPLVRLILLDTQWWLHNGPKPEHPSSTCPADSDGEILDSLRAALSGAGTRRVLVLAHHPLASGGTHSGHFDWTDHVFPLRHLVHWLWLPLPGIGSLYPVARGAGVSPQDMRNGRNHAMRRLLERAFEKHPPLVYRSGHDHNLQVLKGTSAEFFLVSGGGFYGRPYPVTSKPSTLFATSAKGFMRLDFMTDGRVRLGVIAVHGAGVVNEEFSAWLAESRVLNGVAGQ
ncbi:MAG: metallophosphoesterase [Gemmatimonadetes bacterium]|nr:metallophosphoesterase [Gemmatimonadota bacterium]